MSIVAELKDVNEYVLHFLEKDPRTRDNDRLLAAKIWYFQLKLSNDVLAIDFFKNYSREDSPMFSQESIGRARRRLQEERPELRGKEWEKRHGDAKEVKEFYKNK